MSGSDQFLILSGTYLDAALTAEFGRVPPAFLPVGTHRLFEEQVAFAARHGKPVTITLPSDFTPAPADAAILARADVHIVRLDAGLSLAAALASAIDEMKVADRLIVLFGDTIVEYGDAVSKPDTFAAGMTSHFAVWAEYETGRDGTTRFTESLERGRSERSVACGLFDFSDASRLRSCLSAEKSFFAAINRYGRTYPLRAQEVSRWLDFGHLHTYYQSRKHALAARKFNRIDAEGGVVRKTGLQSRKIFAEAEWYRRLPSRLKTYAPQLLGIETGSEVSYEIEYLFLPALSELFCFGALPTGLWRGILASCRDVLEICHDIRPAPYEVQPGFHDRFFTDMVGARCIDRLTQFTRAADIDDRREWTINGKKAPDLLRLTADLVRIIGPTTPSDICQWHGDFHFGNLLFDFRAQRVKCIDPRGMLSDGSVTMYGDARYDIAKLTHSVIGLYDFLIAGRYSLETDGKYKLDLEFDLPAGVVETQRFYERMSIGHYGVYSPQIVALCALLFLSMLPLHAESPTRQLAMLANGIRLARLAGAA